MELLTVLILAGGRSTRMGRDKAWLELGGTPLVEHVARRLLPIAAEIVFSAPEPHPFEELIRRLPIPARVVIDEYRDGGPLAGLHAGLRAAAHESVLAVATDMPFVNYQLVGAMAAACGSVDAIVPRLLITGGDLPQPEPLHAIYRKSCIPAIEKALGAGRRRVISFLQDVNVCYLDEDVLRKVDPELKSFWNANTPDEWVRAGEQWRKAG